jgi:Domain of unknown function (DUF4388)
MPRLWGTLTLTGLPALVQFLGEVGATGRMRLTGASRTGELWLHGGRLVEARSGAKRGRAALAELARPEGEFAFVDEPALPPPDPDLAALEAAEALALLRAAADGWVRLDSLPAARWVLAPPVERPRPDAPADQEEALALDRQALHVLLAIGRGEGTPERLAAAGDPDAVFRALETLRDLGLIRQVPPEPAAPGEPAPSPGQGSPRGGFRPAPYWQEVPQGVAVPPGGEYRMELGGKVYARWPRLTGEPDAAGPEEGRGS